jgi:P-type conjugative transfer protein TrbL
MGNIINVADFFAAFIDAILAGINKVIPYSRNTLYILTVLNVAWFGIQTALGKYELSGLLEKFLTLGISVYVVKEFPGLSKTVLNSLTGLASVTGMGTDVLTNPARIFSYAQTHILEPIKDTIAAEFSGVSGLYQAVTNGSGTINFFIHYALFIIIFYICMALVVVQIMLTYINYHITLLFGEMLLPFSIFKPLEFIGNNVFKAVLTQALSVAVVIFIADLGLRVFGQMITASLINSIRTGGGIGPSNVSHLWAINAFVLVYFMLCMKAPALVMSLVSGAPVLGAAGLFSTIASIAAMATGAVSVFAEGGGGSGAAGGQALSAPQQAAGESRGHAQDSGAAAPAQAERGMFLPPPASASAPGAVNALGPPPDAQALPAPSPSPFLPPPSRAAVPAPRNSADPDFSYRVVS